MSSATQINSDWKLDLSQRLRSYIAAEKLVSISKILEAGVLRLLSDESADLSDVASDCLISIGEHVRDGEIEVTSSGLIRMAA